MPRRGAGHGVQGDPVSVQVVYPPDTDTEGYRLEQVGKPRETHLISEAAGLFRAEDVARRMADAALAPSPPHQWRKEKTRDVLGVTVLR